MYQVVANYPGTAAGGACFLSRAGLDDLVEIDPLSGEPRTRREQVVITDRDVDFEGLVCLGERTVRHLAHLFGMVDGWAYDRLVVQHNELVGQHQQVARALGDADREIEGLEAQVDRGRREVFVAVDGSRWPTVRAAQEQSRVAAGMEVAGLAAARQAALAVEVREGELV